MSDEIYTLKDQLVELHYPHLLTSAEVLFWEVETYYRFDLEGIPELKQPEGYLASGTAYLSSEWMIPVTSWSTDPWEVLMGKTTWEEVGYPQGFAKVRRFLEWHTYIGEGVWWKLWL